MGKASIEGRPRPPRAIDVEYVAQADLAGAPWDVKHDGAWFWSAGERLGYGALVPIPPFPHVAEASFIVLPPARRFVPEIYHAVRELVLLAQRMNGYRRVQSLVAAHDEKRIHFAERLGFVREELRPGAGPRGEAMWMMLFR